MTDLEIKAKVVEELVQAEKIWDTVKPHFVFEKAYETRAFTDKVIPTKIPGHTQLTHGKPEVADFVALVLDIRKSSEHLLVAIDAKASQLERVLYETTAINTAGLLIINKYKGGVTELLGDGFLSLFKVENETAKEGIYAAYNAAKKCLSITKEIINPILFNRYGLPPLNIGIGLAFSRAIVTTIGIENNLHPKAIGECVFRASKLSGEGINEIYIDKRLKYRWPSEKGGTLHFNFSHNVHGFEAYKIGKRK